MAKGASVGRRNGLSLSEPVGAWRPGLLNGRGAAAGLCAPCPGQQQGHRQRPPRRALPRCTWPRDSEAQVRVWLPMRLSSFFILLFLCTVYSPHTFLLFLCRLATPESECCAWRCCPSYVSKRCVACSGITELRSYPPSSPF